MQQPEKKMKKWKAVLIALELLMISYLNAAAVSVVGYDNANDTLIRWASDGSVVCTNSDITHDAYQLELGPDGYIYLGAWTDDRVYKIDPDTCYPPMTVAHQQVAATDRTWDITFGNDIDSDGIDDLWVAAGHNGAGDCLILAYGSSSGYDGSSEQVCVITEGIRRAVALDFGPDVSGDGIPDLWVVDGDNNDSGNYMLVVDVTSCSLLNRWSLSSLRGSKDVEVVGDRVYVTSPNAHDIYSFALDGTDETRVVTGSDSPEFYMRQIQPGLDGMWYTANRFPGTWSSNPSITVFDTNWIFDSVYTESAGSDWSGVVTIQEEVDPCPDPPLADLTGDCIVDMDDLLIMISQWLMDTDPAN